MKVGFIGLGSMGAPIARHLAGKGPETVTAVDADPARLAGLDGPGLVATTDRGRMAGAEVLFLCLPDGAVVEAAALEAGVTAALPLLASAGLLKVLLALAGVVAAGVVDAEAGLVFCPGAAGAAAAAAGALLAAGATAAVLALALDVYAGGAPEPGTAVGVTALIGWPLRR